MSWKTLHKKSATFSNVVSSTKVFSYFFGFGGYTAGNAGKMKLIFDGSTDRE